MDDKAQHRESRGSQISGKRWSLGMPQNNINERLQEIKTRDPNALKKRWSLGMPGQESLPISPIEQEGSETITMSTDPTTPIRNYQDQEIQCEMDEKGKTIVQPPSEESLPTGSRLAILVICTCMAIFLQALVSHLKMLLKLLQ